MSENNLCLNCGKEVKGMDGKRPKKFCSDNCRASYWSKNNPKREPKWVKVEVYQSLKDKYDELVASITNRDFIPQSKTAEFNNSKKKDSFIKEEPMQWEEPKFRPYNQLLGCAMTAKTVEECTAIVAEVMLSDFPEWQKSNIEKAAKDRSRHPDLN